MIPARQELYIDARHERLVDALHDAHERTALELQIPGYLQAQRWFGGQSRSLHTASIERWVELESGACIFVVGVTDTTGLETQHQLYLVTGERDGQQRVVIDALENAAVCDELLNLVLSGARREDYRAALVCEPTGLGTEDCTGEARLAGVEQSNSSVVYGEHCILKVYRRLERGTNPEVELGRYLSTEANFDLIPPVLATARLESADGYSVDALLLQQYVPNEGDGWSWAVDTARRAMVEAQGPDALGTYLEAERNTLDFAGALGEATARLHAALASAKSEEMAPQAVPGEVLERWAADLRREADETASLLQHSDTYAPELLEALRRVTDAVQLPTPEAVGLQMRVHGDYHLGQVLRGRDGKLYILDLEGEPARSLAERRELRSPLVDVAGMVRSFSYAAHAAALDHASEDMAAAWERIVRNRFLEAYHAAASGTEPAILPRDEVAHGRLLAHFELQKVLYEVRYELNNRPEWLYIPAAGVRRLLGA